ncbi:MAG: hypothetical protein M3462_09580 [Chloroflexota bacterium]|nr:hypothetical protein [Chloroflexota bacterium]
MMNPARLGPSWSILSLTVMTIGVMALLASPAAVLAQASSPAASPEVTFGEPIPPEVCTVERRTLESMPDGALATSSPTEPASPAAFTLPEGTPADDETVAAITAVLVQSIACTNAGDPLRQFGTLTDSYIATLLVEAGLPDLSPAIYGFLSTPVATSPETWRSLDAVEDVQVLLDGRIGAVVTTTGTGTGTARSFVVFVERDGGFLIDRLAGIETTGATPAA